MKINIIRFILKFFLLLFILPVELSAMGSVEKSRVYKSERQQVFDELIVGIYNGENDASSVKMRFQELRTKHDVSYTDEAGILDSIIDRAVEQSLSRDETEFYFRLLQEGRLMKYRQKTYMANSEQYKRELLSLLYQQLESIDTNTDGPNELLISLNNYYDLVGLEYDEEYFQLKDIILLFYQGKISVAEIAVEFKLIDKQLMISLDPYTTQNKENQAVQNGEGASTQNSEGASFQGGGQQVTGNNSAGAASQQSSSGASGQKVSPNGSGLRK